MSNKLVKNNKVNESTTKGAEVYATVISKVISDLEKEKLSQVTLDTGEIMLFSLSRDGIVASVIPLFVDIKTAEKRLVMIRDKVSEYFGFTNTTYKKVYMR